MRLVERMKKKPLGRLLCRLFGEERGAIMMEYVIVALLVAAAAVAAVAFFGRDIVNMFGTIGKAATGESKGALEDRQTAKGKSETGHTNAVKENDAFSTLQNEDSGSGSNTSGSSTDTGSGT